MVYQQGSVKHRRCWAEGEGGALLDRYNEVFGAYISQLLSGQPLDRFTGAFRQESFAVFNRNTDKL